MLLRVVTLALIAIFSVGTPSRAETPEEWVELGTRIHGFFGGFIPVGIRIGLDARERLDREVDLGEVSSVRFHVELPSTV